MKLLGLLKNSVQGKNKYLDKLMDNGHYRLVMKANLSCSWSLIYAIFHFGMATFFRSYWFLTMGTYYTIACFMKIFALRLGHGKDPLKSERNALVLNTVLMFFLTVVFSGIVGLSIAERKNSSYHTIIVITLAAYTFSYFISAVVQMVRLRKRRTVQTILLRNTAMAFALGSMFSLERTMLGTYGDPNEQFTVVMEAVSGAGFVVVILTLAIGLCQIAAGKKYPQRDLQDP